jgi:crotonobetainyl-CoA:carnitine CoA-transferase CaiB-like acyl-CoA transferase
MSFERFMGSYDMLEKASHPAFGDYWRSRSSIDFSEMSTYLGPACSVGEHTESILAGLGYSPEAIDTLLAEGVIGSGRPAATSPLLPAPARTGS